MKFTWGDSVVVKAGARAAHRPGQLGEVVAITEVENWHLATLYSVSMGSVVFSVEFGDGYTVEIPEHWLTEPRADEAAPDSPRG